MIVRREGAGDATVFSVIEGEEDVVLHPATAALVRFFAWEHLPAVLQKVSRPFGELAEQVARGPQGAETTTALRKLLEAKDCAVRAALPPAPAYPLIPRDDA